MEGLRRNDPCPCGCGKKYRKCCRPKGEEPMRGRLPAVPFDFDGDAFEAISNRVGALVRAGDLDAAEALGIRLRDEYPYMVDGHERLARVYEARGERTKALECRRRTLEYMETYAGFDEEIKVEIRLGIGMLAAGRL